MNLKSFKLMNLKSFKLMNLKSFVFQKKFDGRRSIYRSSSVKKKSKKKVFKSFLKSFQNFI